MKNQSKKWITLFSIRVAAALMKNVLTSLVKIVLLELRLIKAALATDTAIHIKHF